MADTEFPNLAATARTSQRWSLETLGCGITRRREQRDGQLPVCAAR
jgi:hypothetical protein